MLPSNLQNINFNWIDLNEHYIEMVNNIPNYYHAKIFFKIIILVILDLNGQFMLSVIKNMNWSSDIYEVQGKYRYPIYGPIIIFFC